MTTGNMKISTVIPAHNEAGNVENMARLIFANLKSQLLELIVVNDCSTDNTGKILNTLKKKYKKLIVIHRKNNGGVGNAMREGLKNISNKSTHVLLLDCDFTKNTLDIKNLIKAVSDNQNVDGVVGARFIKGGVLEGYALPKKVANRSFHLLAKILFGMSQWDVTNNFKFYKKEVIDRIMPYLESPGFSINAETGIYPILFGYNIKEVPVSWIERTKGMGISDFKVLKVGPGYFKVFLRALMYRVMGFPVKAVVTRKN